MVRLRLLPAVLLAAALVAGCGGGDDAAQTTTPAKTTSTTPAKAKPKSTGTTDRGARRCTRTAFLAALLGDVARAPFKVDEVRCEGEFARSRFVNIACGTAQGSTIACDGAKVAAWRLGSKRWRLIVYKDSLSCSEIRKSAAEFPSALCN